MNYYNKITKDYILLKIFSSNFAESNLDIVELIALNFLKLIYKIVLVHS